MLHRVCTVFVFVVAVTLYILFHVIGCVPCYSVKYENVTSHCCVLSLRNDTQIKISFLTPE